MSNTVVSQSAAVYIRVSTQEQKKGWSPGVQRNVCLQNAQECGFVVPGEFIFDEGISGDFWERAEFTKLRQCIFRRRIKAVFVQFSNRIARVSWHQQRFYAECHQAGVTPYIGKEPVHPSRSSRFTFGIRSLVDQDQKEELLERTRQGRQQRAKVGLPAGGTVPMGYDVVYLDRRNTQWAINEEEAKIVEQIFDWYTHGGLSINGIARRLSEMHVLTKIHRLAAQGKHTPWKKIAPGTWSYSSVKAILKNDTYIGTAHQQRMRVIEPSLVQTDQGEVVRARREKRPDKEWLSFEVPQIIWQEVFEAAKARLSRNLELSTRNSKSTYLVRGRWFRCQCGKRMGGLRVHGRRYYRCTSRRQYHGHHCGGMIRAQEAESLVWLAVENILLDPEKLATYAKQQEETSDEERARLERDIAQHQADLAQTETNWSTILEGQSRGIFSLDDVAFMRSKIDQRRRDLEAQLQKDQEQLKSLIVQSQHIHAIVAYVERLREEQLRKTLQNVIDLYKDDPAVMWDLLEFGIEESERQRQQFRERWDTMSPEQRTNAEHQWHERQMRQQLQPLSIGEKWEIFDAVGLHVTWTKGVPLHITVRIPQDDEDAGNPRLRSASRRQTRGYWSCRW